MSVLPKTISGKISSALKWHYVFRIFQSLEYVNLNTKYYFLIYKNCFCILTSLSLLEYFRLSIQQSKTLKTADFNGVLHVVFTPTQVNLEKKSQFLRVWLWSWYLTNMKFQKIILCKCLVNIYLRAMHIFELLKTV